MAALAADEEKVRYSVLYLIMSRVVLSQLVVRPIVCFMFYSTFISVVVESDYFENVFTSLFFIIV